MATNSAMTMKSKPQTPSRILLVSYDFPPAVAGVRRIVKFARYLPGEGFAPIVVAADPIPGTKLDRETLEQVRREGYPVLRTASLDPYHLWAWLRSAPGRIKSLSPFRRSTPAARMLAEEIREKRERDAENARQTRRRGPVGRWLRNVARGLARWFLIPDDRVGWVTFASAASERILRTQRVRYVVTTSYPNSAHLVGLHLKRRFKVKWVADFRDGWTQNPYFGKGPTGLHRAVNRMLEARVARKADLLITVSEPIARHLRELSGRDNVHVIPNGFDPADLADLPREHFDKFTLAYTGTLFMQRSPENFFAAVRGLLDEFHGLAEHFQVVFMTQFKPEHEEAIRHLGLGDVIVNRGLGTYREALALQASADALLVLEGPAENSEIMLTQKIFEYLAARKAILAVAPPGALADTLRRSGCGVVVAPDDVFSIKERLNELFHGQLDFRPDDEYIATFQRQRQTAELTRLLKSLN
ncbi:MAG: glycosyltransferase [Candidatus Sumerlaeaceae bacterium]|nr:glycosyltransferase [Candidatus Sumerlaeaceae bacterium]